MAEITAMARKQARLARIAVLQKLVTETVMQLQWEADADKLVVEELWQRAQHRQKRQEEVDETVVMLFDERCALKEEGF